MARLDRRAAESTSRYVVTAVDVRGRLGDRSGLRAMDWAPGHRISVHVTAEMAIITGRADGPSAITRQGHLRLRSSDRHALSLEAGDRVLLVARPSRDLLIVYPIPVLDMMLRRHDLLPGGGG